MKPLSLRECFCNLIDISQHAGSWPSSTSLSLRIKFLATITNFIQVLLSFFSYCFCKYSFLILKSGQSHKKVSRIEQRTYFFLNHLKIQTWCPILPREYAFPLTRRFSYRTNTASRGIRNLTFYMTMISSTDPILSFDSYPAMSFLAKEFQDYAVHSVLSSLWLS